MQLKQELGWQMRSNIMATIGWWPSYWPTVRTQPRSIMSRHEQSRRRWPSTRTSLTGHLLTLASHQNIGAEPNLSQRFLTRATHKDNSTLRCPQLRRFEDYENITIESYNNNFSVNKKNIHLESVHLSLSYLSIESHLAVLLLTTRTLCDHHPFPLWFAPRPKDDDFKHPEGSKVVPFGSHWTHFKLQLI